MAKIMTPLQFIMKNGNNDPLKLSPREIDSVLMKSFNEFNEHYNIVTAHSKMHQELLATSNTHDKKVFSFGMNICIRTLTGKSFTIKLFPYSTIKDLLDEIQKKESIPPNQVRLVYNGKEIPHSKAPLIWYLTDLDKPQVIHLILRLRGGMMHESSGRTGYVNLLQSSNLTHEAQIVLGYAKLLANNQIHQHIAGGGGGCGRGNHDLVTIDTTLHANTLRILLNAVQIHSQTQVIQVSIPKEDEIKVPNFNVEFMRSLLYRN